MNKIQKLPSHLADMIAAGEVVERPASVVKELFENAVDAGGTNITIEIKNGGLTYISVSDNGFGIPRDDALSAFLRHATSKIAKPEDLEGISTLGFRGEALAAIASVSRVEMITRTIGETEGTRVLIEGGHSRPVSPAARAVGTTVNVLDLFFNTPARQKFMKTDRAEASAITAEVTRLALSRPDVAVRYIRDGKEELQTPGDGRSDSCVYAVLGRDFISGSLAVESENEGIIVRGFVSKISALRGNRTQQFFIVNGRCIKSTTLQAALEQAYRNRIFTGRFPTCVLYIDLSPARLDVNVHPAKTEVKFLFEKHIFDAVRYGALAALDSDLAVPSIDGRATEDNAGEKEDFVHRFSENKEEAAFEISGVYSPLEPVEKKSPLIAPVNSPVITQYETAVETQDEQQCIEDDDEDRNQVIIGEVKEDFRLIGEGLETYIILESKGSIWLIDKHAAHERHHFDRLKAMDYDPMPQVLIAPVVINLGSEGIDLMLKNSDLMERIGFHGEEYGEGILAIRQIPSSIDIDDTESILTEICTELSRGGDTSRHLDKIYASVACKSAIKAGRESAREELLEIADMVMSGKIRHCPHGRPVAVEITKNYIDKSFKRI